MGTGPLRIDVPDVIYSNTEAQSDRVFFNYLGTSVSLCFFFQILGAASN